MVDLRSSETHFQTGETLWVYLRSLSHDLHACGNVLMHIDMFSGM